MQKNVFKLCVFFLLVLVVQSQTNEESTEIPTDAPTDEPTLPNDEQTDPVEVSEEEADQAPSIGTVEELTEEPDAPTDEPTLSNDEQTDTIEVSEEEEQEQPSSMGGIFEEPIEEPDAPIDEPVLPNDEQTDTTEVSEEEEQEQPSSMGGTIEEPTEEPTETPTDAPIDEPTLPDDEPEPYSEELDFSSDPRVFPEDEIAKSPQFGKEKVTPIHVTTSPQFGNVLAKRKKVGTDSSRLRKEVNIVATKSKSRFVVTEFQWYVGSYGPCSKECDFGYQYRRVVCYDAVRIKQSHSYYCRNIGKPLYYLRCRYRSCANPQIILLGQGSP